MVETPPSAEVLQAAPKGKNLRVTVSAERTDVGWRFVLTCREAPDFRIERTAGVDPLTGAVPLPATPCCREGKEWCLGADAARVEKAMADLRRRSGTGGV